MSERTDQLTDDTLAQFLRTRAADAEPGLLDDIVRAVGATPQVRPWLGLRPIRLTGRTLLIAATLLLATIGAIAVGSRLLLPKPDLGIFASVAGRIVYGFDNSEGETYRAYGEDGIWGLDPASSDLATPVQLTSEAGTPLGWSSDGTRLLIQRGNENLVVLHADGSETLVTEQPWGLKGATISPDGSRVAFGALLEERDEHGGLFAVDADGGQAELLWESQSRILRSPTFSPDGAQIAFVDDNIDSFVSVWVINADGTDAHQIVPSGEPFGAGRVRGLAWSPAGDRIALMAELDEDPDPTTPLGLYTFAPDGSDFRRIADVGVDGYAVIGPPYWSPDGTQIEYTTGCNGSNAEGQVFGCMLAIVDADGSVVRTFLNGIAGPWHPGSAVNFSTPSPTPSAAAGYGLPPEDCGYLNPALPLVWAAREQRVRQVLGEDPSESVPPEIIGNRPARAVSDETVGDIYVQDGGRSGGSRVCVISDAGTVYGFWWPAELRPPSQ